MRLEEILDADVRLNWNASIGAAAYHVYRSSASDVGFAQIAQPVDLHHDDPGVLADGLDWCYLVVAADACGNESQD